jgi:hypothetical protein
MLSSGILRCVARVRTDVSGESDPSQIGVSISELETTLAVTSNRSTLPIHSILCSVHRLLVTAKVVPSSPILVTLMMGTLRSSETSVLTRATQRNIPED